MLVQVMGQGGGCGLQELPGRSVGPWTECVGVDARFMVCLCVLLLFDFMLSLGKELTNIGQTTRWKRASPM